MTAEPLPDPNRAFRALPGAVAPLDAAGEPSIDAAPLHYGAPLAEQRALAAGAAVVLLDRGVVEVTGPDRLEWLDAMTSQQLAGLTAPVSRETLLLDPNGRIEQVLKLIEDGERSWLLVEPQQTAPLLAWLERMRFRSRVELADRSAELFVLGRLGDGDDPVAGLLRSAGDGPLEWSDDWHAVLPGGHQYSAAAPHPAAEWSWRELLLPRTALPQLLAALAAGEPAVAGTLAAEALRIAAWRPRFGAEVDDRAIPHEFDWLRTAVHLAKGCYRGQETVAKVHNLGHPPRRLTFLHLDGSEAIAVAPGDEVRLAGAPADDRPVGRVTSVALHHELGPIALALLRRGTDPGAGLVVRAAEGEVAAAQEVIVPPEAGATAQLPRLGRGVGRGR